MIIKSIIKMVQSVSSRIEEIFQIGNAQEQSILEKYLLKFVKKNTTDYFIHKNLRSFLERELEFFIKNEILDLAEMEKMDDSQLKFEMIKSKCISSICLRIIDILSQIEDFQKTPALTTQRLVSRWLTSEDLSCIGNECFFQAYQTKYEYSKLLQFFITR